MKLAKLQLLSLLCVSMFSNLIYAKNVEYIEDAYSMQAPAHLVVLADRAANLAGYEGDYQITVPKKAAIEINPWNKFMAHGINPANQKPFISINPEWVKGMPADQQEFLLVRAFTFFVQGSTPLAAKILPFVFLFIGVFVIFALFWLLGNTSLVNKPRWVSIVVALLLATIFNQLVTNNVLLHVTKYFNGKYDLKINEIAIQKTGNKDAGIKALEHYNQSIKSELLAGQTFWAPFENMFEPHLQDLKK